MGVLEQAYKTAMDKPLRVLDIFNEFFGESRVDMQGFPTLADVESVLPNTSSTAEIKEFIIRKTNRDKGFILVHFPHVRITNEFDKYTDANHLYAKVTIDVDGKIQGRFSLNRAEYTVIHFTNDYMHSHISSIPTHNLTEFQTPCTGSGPINNTICSLARDFDEDLWRLFCLELDRFMQVESIAGTPYHRLEGLVAGGRGYTINSHTSLRAQGRVTVSELGGRGSLAITIPQLAEFTKYVIDNDILKFTYQNGGYYLAMSPTKYYVLISNAFIKWYNRKYRRHEVSWDLNGLLAREVLVKLKFVDNHLVRESNHRRDYHPYIGRKICTFKGQDVLFSISDAREAQREENDVYILRQEIAEYIFTKIFNVLNFRYGNNKQQGDDTPCKKVYYL